MNIKDIAKICDVSPSTVSKIMHNKDHDISVKTRKKVLEVIKEYQYVPYYKVLKNADPKTNLIGVMIAEDTYKGQEILYSIEESAIAQGYSILVCNTMGNQDKVTKYLNILENKNVDGVISVSGQEGILEGVELPGVCIHNEKREEQGKEAEIYYEMQDAGYLASEYLLKKGHRRIACLLLEEDADIEEGYLKAYKEYFTFPNKEWIFKGSEENIMNIGISKCMNLDVTAIICANVEIGNIIYERLKERGDMIPNRISVISVRNSKLAQLVNPKMTTVNIPAKEMAKTAVDILVQIMENRKSAYECKKKIEMEIQKGNSVASPMQHREGGKIVIVGSMNMDYNFNVSHIPTGGETLKANNIMLLPGGKGANQAVGAGKLDGHVYMIGCLGNDKDGKEIYNSLVNSGVKTDGIMFDDSVPTGKAYVNVAKDGESTIVIYPGANQKLNCNQIRHFDQILDGAKYCLLTLEISEETVEYTINKCRKKNVEVILKPSAVENVKDSLLKKIDYFIPNEKEVKQLIAGDTTIEEKAKILFDQGVKNVIITLGHKGCYLKNKEQQRYFPAVGFQAVDTTGAADAFISALAVCLSEGNDIAGAINFATYAAGISITRLGVQSAMADRIELDAYKDEIDSISIETK